MVAALDELDYSSAYHRSRLSKWFHPTTADTLLSTLECPGQALQ